MIFRKIARIISVAFAVIRGQILLFPRLNYGLVKAYGCVNIRGCKSNITFGTGVTFLGNATLIAGNEYLNDQIEFGKDVLVENGCYINAHGGYVKIGDFVFLGVSSILQGMGGICIGKNSMLGPNVQIYSSDHQYKQNGIPYKSQTEKCSLVNIGNNVWIGANSIILRGTALHENTVVGAGSVVNTITSEPSLLVTSRGFAVVKSKLNKSF